MINFTLRVCSVFALLVLVVTVAAAAVKPIRSNDHRCDAYPCYYGGRCQVVDEKAKCRCLFLCTKEYKPVCGTDGKIYGNSCVMASKSCELQQEIKEDIEGKCFHSVTEDPIRLSTHISPGIGLPKLSTPRPCIRNPPPIPAQSHPAELENEESDGNVETEVNEYETM